MENLINPLQNGPEEDNQHNLENKENRELKPLAVVPIYRNNDLYAEMFPDVDATFERGEQPDYKKIAVVILSHPGENVILDNTCRDELMYKNFTPDDFPEQFEGAREAVKDGRLFSLSRFVKTNYGTKILNDSIEGMINKEVLGKEFSPELIEELFQIAKNKNENIKKVYILSDAIDDHVYAGSNFQKDQVLPALVEGVKKNFDTEPVVVPTLTREDIREGDLIVADRHNPLVSSGAVSEYPAQFTVLPMETELSNNERYLGGKTLKVSEGLAMKMRRVFEVKEEE